MYSKANLVCGIVFGVIGGWVANNAVSYVESQNNKMLSRERAKETLCPCSCGCAEGKRCTCGEKCGCKCGCNEGKKCVCGEKAK